MTTLQELLFLSQHSVGVIPGKGVCPEDTDNVKFDSNLCPRRRLSFMVGFWRSIKAKNRGPGCPGPGKCFR